MCSNLLLFLSFFEGGYLTFRLIFLFRKLGLLQNTDENEIQFKKMHCAIRGGMDHS